jgi:hypothetical protein
VALGHDLHLAVADGLAGRGSRHLCDLALFQE